MRWIRKLLGLCVHEWEIHAEFSIVEREGMIPHGMRYVLRCKHCGDMTQRKMY